MRIIVNRRVEGRLIEGQSELHHTVFFWSRFHSGGKRCIAAKVLRCGPHVVCILSGSTDVVDEGGGGVGHSQQDLRYVRVQVGVVQKEVGEQLDLQAVVGVLEQERGKLLLDLQQTDLGPASVRHEEAVETGEAAAVPGRHLDEPDVETRDYRTLSVRSEFVDVVDDCDVATSTPILFKLQIAEGVAFISYNNTQQ